ncbi:MAG: DUF2934 domain-containing protein [Steroidobacter sp.]
METTPVSTATRTLKVRTTKSPDATPGKAAKTVTVKRKPKTLVKPSPLGGNLSEMIATAAYFIAQQRNFVPGSELSDWLTAEQQILASHTAKN